MKISIFTMGTRGDVQPYIYLAHALMKKGHEVYLGSHPCWRALIEDAGIHFVPIGPDISIEKEAAVIRGKNSNAILAMLKTMNFIFKIIQNSTGEIYEACKGKDLVVVSHSQMGGTEAQALGIPMINITLQAEMIPEKRKKQSLGNRIIGNMISAQMVKPYNKIRKVYGLPKLSPSDDIMFGKYNLIPISSFVKPRNPYWEEKNILTGYWYEEESEYIPNDNLAAFLRGGEKPIILALGAMAFEDKSEKEKLDMFVKAFQRRHLRAIIQGFEKSLQDYEFPDTMISCGSVPHSWLFRQGYAVIHHCGFGTASATLIYGIPSIPIPHVLDQMGFANELFERKVSTKPIKAKELSVERIESALDELSVSYESILETARELSGHIQKEDGLGKAVKLIESI